MDQPAIPLVYTQSLLVVANTSYDFGEHNNQKADENTQLDRLYALIQNIIKKGEKVHLQTNYQSPQKIGLFSTTDSSSLTIKKECLNNITLLVTNEFMFYTKRRLEPHEFALLFEKIFDLAQKQPENFHLVLSSFAVRSLNNKTMNVVAFVECGKTPKLHFFVKNYDSTIDPLYYHQTAGGKARTEFDNIDISYDSEKKFPKIKIHGKKYKFSYNNVFEVMTLGGLKKFVAIDVCLDHIKMVAKQNCTVLVKKSCAGSKNLIPTQITHVVTSNQVQLSEGSKLANHMIYADPKNTLFYLKKNNLLLSHKVIKSERFFGTPESQMYIMPLMQCSPLPPELFTPVKNHNDHIMASIAKKEAKKSNKKP